MRLFRWLLDRFRPADIPAGWDLHSLDEIRPHFTDPWQADDEDTAVLVVVDEHLGPLVIGDPPSRPVRLFEAVRELHPVDLSWRPGWLDGLVMA